MSWNGRLLNGEGAKVISHSQLIMWWAGEIDHFEDERIEEVEVGGGGVLGNLGGNSVTYSK